MADNRNGPGREKEKQGEEVLDDLSTTTTSEALIRKLCRGTSTHRFFTEPCPRSILPMAPATHLFEMADGESSSAGQQEYNIWDKNGAGREKERQGEEVLDDLSITTTSEECSEALIRNLCRTASTHRFFTEPCPRSILPMAPATHLFEMADGESSSAGQQEYNIWDKNGAGREKERQGEEVLDDLSTTTTSEECSEVLIHNLRHKTSTHHFFVKPRPRSMAPATSPVPNATTTQSPRLAPVSPDREPEFNWSLKNKYMFFWRKDKSTRRQISEMSGAQTASKIVILEPNPERGIDQKANTGPRQVMDEPDAVHMEGIDKFDCRGRISNTEYIPAEGGKDDAEQVLQQQEEEGKEPIRMPMNSAENIVEQLEQQEPETPEPRASTKLVLHGSPEQSNGKKEEPSPVSALESFLEGIGGFECINKKEYELSEDLHRTLYSQTSTHEQIIKRDFKTQTWMDTRSEVESIVLEIWDELIDDLIDEAVFDLWLGVSD